MSGIFMRIILAVVAIVLIYALLPPVTRVLGVGLDADVILILRICIAAIAIFYILHGPDPGWFRRQP